MFTLPSVLSATDSVVVLSTRLCISSSSHAAQPLSKLHCQLPCRCPLFKSEAHCILCPNRLRAQGVYSPLTPSPPDSLHYTSAASIALAVVFVIITIVVTCINIAYGTITTPRWIPDFSSGSAVMAFFACIPVGDAHGIPLHVSPAKMLER